MTDDLFTPTGCEGCGRRVTLMGNGYCGHCQDEVPGKELARGRQRMTTCQYHPDADPEQTEVRVGTDEGPDRVHAGTKCPECGLILSVGGYIRDYDGGTDV